jgi:hypothetical protein
VTGANLEGRDTWPAFLVGCHRSGTTLARYLLDAHPRLACPPESKFIAGLLQFLHYPQALIGLNSLGTTPDDVVTEFGQLTRRVFDRYARAQGKARWIDKTPNYYRLLPFLDALMNREVLYLVIVRHPFDTIESIMQTPAFLIDQPEDPDIRRASSLYGRDRCGWGRHWLEVYRTILEFRDAESSRCHVFRYEDLVALPEATLSCVLSFLGEAWSDEILTSAFTRQQPGGYMDWKIGSTTGIHAHSVGQWHAWPREERAAVWDIVGQTASGFGYASPLDAP